VAAYRDRETTSGDVARGAAGEWSANDHDSIGWIDPLDGAAYVQDIWDFSSRVGCGGRRLTPKLLICLVSANIVQIASMVQIEYNHLVRCLGLVALPLDVYQVVEDGTGGVTAHGTDKRNSTPGYSVSCLVLPQEPGDLDSWEAILPRFPPISWDPHRSDWPMWRTELWHEVVHQYQHQVLKNTDPRGDNDGHGSGWRQALEDVARYFEISPEQMAALL
jgi:hypothetical protein